MKAIAFHYSKLFPLGAMLLAPMAIAGPGIPGQPAGRGRDTAAKRGFTKSCMMNGAEQRGICGKGKGV